MTDDFTPASPPTEPSSPDEVSERVNLGRIVAGAILVMIGIAWLIEAANWGDVPWRGLLAGALMVVGVVLMIGARSGSHGGLLAFGMVLAVVMAMSGAIEVLADIPLNAGIGEERHRPVAQVDDEYRWGIGSMTVDLRGAADLDGHTIAASVAIGELIVILPDDVAVSVTATSGIGEVRVLDERSAGLGADLELTEQGDGRLVLHLEVAIGKVEVRR